MATEQQVTESKQDGPKSNLPQRDESSRQSSQLMRNEAWPAMRGGPFALMDRLFDQFFGRDLARDWFAPMAWDPSSETGFFPQLEIAQRGDQLEICADLPGVKKDDVKVELHERELKISGERRNEQTRNQAGIYRSERSYGSFCRTIRLPDNAETDQLDAAFDNGVLKIRIPAPATQSKQGRSIEIRDMSEPAPTTQHH